MRTLNNYTGASCQLIHDHKNKYLQREKSSTPLLDYEKTTTQDIEVPFSDQKLIAAIDESNQGSTPGRDIITYRLLNNLSDKSRRDL